MGLKFRRGTTAQKSGSLAFGEPYVNTTLGTLQIGGESGDITLGASGTGSQGSFAGISGSSLDITGNAKIDGNLTVGGAITIGDNSSDTVNVIASLSSSLIPSLTNTFELGSINYFWRDLYISTGSIKMVANGVVVSTLSNTGNGFALDQGVTANGDSSFGTSSAAITAVTGSLKVSGSISLIGALSASTITGIGNVSLYSTSVDSRLVAAEAFSSSLDTTFATDASVTALSSSVKAVTDTFATSASVASATATSISTLSGSVKAVTDTFATSASVASATATSISTLSGSVKTITDAVSGRVTTIEGKTLVSGSSQIDGSLLGSNKTITIGSTSTTLGGTSTTIAGLTSVTSTTFVGALTGNASTVTTNANLTGNVTSVGNATTIASGVVTSDMIVDGTIVNGDINASAAIVDTKLATISTGGKVSNSATTATSANTVSAIVARDASGNFSAGTITAALTGTASNVTTNANLTGDVTSVGNATTIGAAKVTNSMLAGSISNANLANSSITIGSTSTALGATSTTIAGLTSVTSTTFVGALTGNVTGNTSGTAATVTTAAQPAITSVGTLTTLTVSGATATGALTVTGAVTATGDITAYYSDGRLKENLEVIPNALQKVSKLTGYTYNTNALGKQLLNNENDNDIKVGIIAQDLQEVLPQAVKFAPFDRDAEGNSKSGENYLTVQYEKIVPLLIEAIKEQQQQIEKLRMDLDNYECKCDNCKSK